MYSKLEASNKDPTGGLNHVHPSCKTEAEAGVCKSDPVYMNIICDKSFCDGIVIITLECINHKSYNTSNF